MTEQKAPSVDLTHTTLSLLVIALLTVSSLWVLSPFFMAIIWAGIVSIATWPLFLKLEHALGNRRGPAVTVMTIAILLIGFVPVMLALTTIVKNAGGITAEIRALESVTLPTPPDWLARIPVAGRKIIDKWTAFAALDPEHRTEVVAPYLQAVLQWFVSKAGSAGSMLIQFLLTTIITTILLANGESVRDGILSFSRRLAGHQGEDVAVLAARAVRGVVLGVVVTALLQAAIAGVGLFVSGVPAAGLLTAVTLFLCLAQLGPLLVMLPAAFWLYWSGQTGWAISLFVITIVAGAIDNFIRPVLIRRGANLPLLLIFAGVIGGLVAFGVVGLFVGPVVLTVTYTLLKAWVTEEESH